MAMGADLGQCFGLEMQANETERPVFPFSLVADGVLPF